ncbi:disulfide bond formation protein B [Sphingomonas quercus]|uniref:Disulfide bond formation protein B n=1 Tax=Sphingomonas quercus TaxID=2842451 RepID=A0ABS6BMS0_9SPHN|nr:disulfide bond formation protein B [Sphingomonas quercus]MBU3078505.1 disulfide bond formation protein B [Sphingomonas quercus]
MARSRTLAAARLLAFLVPAALLAGAWGSQLIGGLYPCEMCHWQRWPHYAALVVAGFGFLAPLRHSRGPVALAALLILASGLIGVFHAGVEYHWWQGFTQCSVSAVGGSSADILKDIMSTPLIRCDAAQWTLFGVSLAGFNAIISIAAALGIFTLLRKVGR